MEFIIYIGLAPHYRIPDSLFFRFVIVIFFSLYVSLSLLPVPSYIGMHFEFLMLVLLQELGQDKAYISETLFTFIFLSFILVRPCLSFHLIASNFFFSMKFSNKYGSFYGVLMICYMLCAFAVDISSFLIQEQKVLHSSNMVQDSILLSCKCLPPVFIKVLSNAIRTLNR